MSVRPPKNRPSHMRGMFLLYPLKLNTCRLPALSRSYGRPQITASRLSPPLLSREHLRSAESYRRNWQERPITRQRTTQPQAPIRLRVHSTALLGAALQFILTIFQLLHTPL